jgi:hypothetical protein
MSCLPPVLRSLVALVAPLALVLTPRYHLQGASIDRSSSWSPRHTLFASKFARGSRRVKQLRRHMGGMSIRTNGGGISRKRPRLSGIRR